MMIRKEERMFAKLMTLCVAGYYGMMLDREMAGMSRTERAAYNRSNLPKVIPVLLGAAVALDFIVGA